MGQISQINQIGQPQSNSGNLMSQEYEAKIRGLVNFNSVKFKSNLVRRFETDIKTLIFNALFYSHKIPDPMLISGFLACYRAGVFPMFLPFFLAYSELSFTVIK